MTITTGPITPPPAAVNAPYSFANETRTVNTLGIEPFTLSRDRSSVYGAVRNAAATGLYQFSESGGAPTLIHTFPDKVCAMVETYDGEALVACATGALLGRIYKSSGWSTSKTGATWSVVLNMAGGYPMGDYSCTTGSMSDTGVMVISEQGAQTVATTATGDNAADNATAITNNASKAHRSYVTVDNGSTWTLLYDQLLQSPNLEPRQISGTHPHSWRYIKDDDRMISDFGDNNGQGPNLYGTNHLQLIYSDDWRNVLTGGAATWNTFPLPVDYPSTTVTDAIQLVGIQVTSKAILFGTDGSPYGLAMMPRLGYRQLGAIRWCNMSNGNAPLGLIGKDIVWAGKGLPMFAGYSYSQGSTSPTSAILPRIYCSIDEGQQWFEIWKDSVRTRRANERIGAYGPTLSGKVLAASQDTNNGAWTNGTLLTWDLVKS